MDKSSSPKGQFYMKYKDTYYKLVRKNNVWHRGNKISQVPDSSVVRQGLIRYSKYICCCWDQIYSISLNAAELYKLKYNGVFSTKASDHIVTFAKGHIGKKLIGIIKIIVDNDIKVIFPLIDFNQSISDLLPKGV